ncbi:hypothetical protein NIES4071_18910 [Calothrix sp. NIES-4071]|nr:hypothetical protein NIES4071_18910 [Calothrix sp. NIES-4071]BAZ56224.1 hypothetical protein NIES4105_18860 [Calothrix sp. NIES-4105]
MLFNVSLFYAKLTTRMLLKSIFFEIILEINWDEHANSAAVL